MADLKKYPGIYRGTVFSNKDPLNQRRLRVIVPAILGDSPTQWAWPLDPSGVSLEPPAVKQGVWVMFENGDPSFPIWVGTFGKEISGKYKLYASRVSSTAVVPQITDLLEVVSRPDGTKDVDVTETLLNIVRNRCYGSFYSMAGTTASANTRYFLPFDQVEMQCSNVTVSDTNKLSLVGTGVFNMQFSAQFSNSVSQDRYIDIWLMKNGQNVPNTNSRITTGDKAPWVIASWNFFLEGGGASDYWQIAWSVNGTGVSLHSEAASTGPSRPAIPSVLMTVSKVK